MKCKEEKTVLSAQLEEVIINWLVNITSKLERYDALESGIDVWSLSHWLSQQ